MFSLLMTHWSTKKSLISINTKTKETSSTNNFVNVQERAPEAQFAIELQKILVRLDIFQSKILCIIFSLFKLSVHFLEHLIIYNTWNCIWIWYTSSSIISVFLFQLLLVFLLLIYFPAKLLNKVLFSEMLFGYDRLYLSQSLFIMENESNSSHKHNHVHKLQRFSI